MSHHPVGHSGEMFRDTALALIVHLARALHTVRPTRTLPVGPGAPFFPTGWPRPDDPHVLAGRTGSPR